MLTHEGEGDNMETQPRLNVDTDPHKSPNVVVPSIPVESESTQADWWRHRLAVRADSHELGDDESSSGLSTPIRNTFDWDQPLSYEPDCAPISESPRSLEDDIWSYPKCLITRGSSEVPVPDPTGDLIGERAIQEYYKLVYGTEAPIDPSVAISLEEHYFWTYTSRTLRRKPFPRPKEFIEFLRHFMEFWQKCRGPRTVCKFYTYLSTIGGNLAIDPETIATILSEPLLLGTLNLDQDFDQDLDRTLNDMFPAGSSSNNSLHIQLSDILDAGLEVEAVDQIEKHLNIKGRTVYIFKPNPHDIPMWLQYENNKVARALGLSSLWLETIASLRDLYGNKPDLTRLAIVHDLYPHEPAENTSGFTATLTVNVPKPEPNLLAGKLEKLKAIIEQGYAN